MPVISADPVVPAPCIFIARGPWVRLCHPAFPAPSVFRGRSFCKARAFHAARTRMYASRRARRVGKAKRAHHCEVAIETMVGTSLRSFAHTKVSTSDKSHI